MLQSGANRYTVKDSLLCRKIQGIEQFERSIRRIDVRKILYLRVLKTKFPGSQEQGMFHAYHGIQY
jgi:hypothetical protein